MTGTPRQVVYLVDDDTAVRETLSDLLESFGMEVVSFGSAGEYLQHARSDEVACLLLDLELPDISGLDLQRQLDRETGPPVIFITGHGDIPSSVRAIKAGAIEFLTKPIDTEALVTTIRAAFAQDRIVREKGADLAALRQRLAQLTPREREVLPLVIHGLRNKQAAAVLGITEITIQAHRGQIMRKMRARTFAELVRMGEKLGIEPSKPIAPERN